MLVQEVDWSEGVNNAWNNVAEFVPRFVAFLVILIVGWLLAKLLARATNAVLERVGFDKAVERGGVKEMLAHTKYDASDLVAKLVYYTIVLIALVTAFNVFGPNAISDLLSDLIGWLPNLVIAILIIVIAAAVARAVKDLASAALSSVPYGNVMAGAAAIFILALGVIAALNQVGIATTVTTPVLVAVLATVAGILVVGVGGGLVRPMQQRWERWLDRAETMAPAVQARVAENAPGNPGPDTSHEPLVDSPGMTATGTTTPGATAPLATEEPPGAPRRRPGSPPRG